MSALLAVALLAAQPGPAKQADPDKPAPAYTAFPDLKPPPVPDPAGGRDFKKAQAAYDKAIEELVFAKLPPLPAKPTPLQKVRHEQVGTGLAYLQKTKQIIDIGRVEPTVYKDFFTVAADTHKVAAELHDTPAGRVRCYEVRVILMKAYERLVETRVDANIELSQALDRARFARLETEADLLKLKAEVEKAGKK